MANYSWATVCAGCGFKWHMFAQYIVAWRESHREFFCPMCGEGLRYFGPDRGTENDLSVKYNMVPRSNLKREP